MTQERLAEIEARERSVPPERLGVAATRPPHVIRRVFTNQIGQRCTSFVATCHSTTEPNEAWAEFFANARADIPDLLAEVRRLRECLSDADMVKRGLEQRSENDRALIAEMAARIAAQSEDYDKAVNLAEDLAKRLHELNGLVANAVGAWLGWNRRILTDDPVKSSFSYLSTAMDALAEKAGTR